MRFIYALRRAEIGCEIQCGRERGETMFRDLARPFISFLGHEFYDVVAN